mmetsp:Transcript_30482/g.65857  ORF Transcript_30482/g.65857 Transcript_30482/m.65857 type:complete len:233 (+) Transcript_30482:2365-3063(+)
MLLLLLLLILVGLSDIGMEQRKIGNGSIVILLVDRATGNGSSDVVVVVVVVIITVIEACVGIALVLIIVVAVLPGHLTVVLLSIQLRLNERLHEHIHINHIICSTVTATGATSSRTKLVMHKTLLVHAVVILTTIIIIATTILLAAKVSAVVIIRCGALLELDGVSGDPGEVVVTVELTGGGEDARAESGGCGDVGVGKFNGLAGRGGIEGGEDGDGTEHHGWYLRTSWIVG